MLHMHVNSGLHRYTKRRSRLSRQAHEPNREYPPSPGYADWIGATIPVCENGFRPFTGHAFRSRHRRPDYERCGSEVAAAIGRKSLESVPEGSRCLAASGSTIRPCT